MDILKKIFSYVIGKFGSTPALMDMGDKTTKTESEVMSNISITGNRGDTTVSGRDTNIGQKK